VLLLAGIQFVCACTADSDGVETHRGNCIAAFLGHAERQAQSDVQRREIAHALRDMLDKTPAELRHQRYADYAGNTSKLSITELLQSYFVPNPPSVLDESRFYQDVDAPAAREAIQYQLSEVSRALQ